MVFSSGRVWLGSVTVAGTLLALSLPAVPGTAQAAVIRPGLKPVLASTQMATGIYAQVLEQQLQFVSLNLKSGVAKPKVEIAVKSQDVTKAPEKSPVKDNKPVEVAKAQIGSSSQQISRGSTGSSTVVNHAMSLLGIPYVFGGTTRSGFDCSGFTQYVYAGSGVSLPRTSYEQFNTGTSVSRQQLQPGDLVFFSTYSNGASHVGIYIGGGQFVHASDSGVRVTSLNDSYYLNRYRGARRIGQ